MILGLVKSCLGLAIAALALAMVTNAARAQFVPERKGAITDPIALFSQDQQDRLRWSLKAVRARDGIDVFILSGSHNPDRVVQAWGLDPDPRRQWVLVVADAQTAPQVAMSGGIRPDDRRHALDWATTTGPGAQAFEAALPDLIRAIQPSGRDEATIGFLGLLFPILAFGAFGGVIWLAVRKSRK